MTAAAADPTADSGINRSTRDDEASVRLLRGEVALAQGRAAEALAEFEIAHRVARGHAALTALARAYLALERYDDATTVLEDLLSRRPLGGEEQFAWQLAHLELGAIHERRGAVREAAALYESLLSTWRDADPDLPAAHEARRRLESPRAVTPDAAR
jgi:tetratricopeptide (TPR) repeat protein